MWLNFHGMTLSIKTVNGLSDLKQTAKSARNDVYQRVRVELSWDPSDVDKDRMALFLDNSYAGSLKGRMVIDCAECLGLLNKMVVGKLIFMRGRGGYRSQTAFPRLLERCHSRKVLLVDYIPKDPTESIVILAG